MWSSVDERASGHEFVVIEGAMLAFPCRDEPRLPHPPSQMVVGRVGIEPTTDGL